MLSCVTKNQIFRCSLLPLSLMCERWIVKFTARCPPRYGTQESTGVSAFTPARGDKCLFLPKGLPQSHQQESTVVKKPRLRPHAHAACVPGIEAAALYPIGAEAFMLSPGDNPVITHCSLARFLKGSLFAWNPHLQKLRHTSQHTALCLTGTIFSGGLLHIKIW